MNISFVDSEKFLSNLPRNQLVIYGFYYNMTFHIFNTIFQTKKFLLK